MGNQASCLLPAAAVVVGLDGNLRRVETPAGAAELMLEAPGHVVARWEELRMTRRVYRMRADEQLRAGEAYLLLPVGLVGARVTNRQMAVILSTISGRRRKRRMISSASCCGVRVFPEPTTEAAVRHGQEEEEEEHKVAPEVRVTGFSGQQIGSYRQWRPVLDTIPESY